MNDQQETKLQRRILIVVIVFGAPVFFGLLAWLGLLGS